MTDTLVSEWRYELTPLTPLHIAAGDTIEPFEYVIDAGRLYKFEPEAFLLTLAPDEQNQFVELAGKNLLQARQFLSERGDLIKQIAEYSVLVDQRAEKDYIARLSNPQSDLSIGVFIRTNRRAYIPGSSLKGALRTALLYMHAKKPIADKQANLLEAVTFGYLREQRDGRKFPSVTDDPFKYFKISDSDARDEITQLMRVNVHTKQAEGSWSDAKIPLLREVTWGVLMDHSKTREVTFNFSVLVNEVLARVAKRESRAQWFDAQKIIAACRAFYGEHLEQEAEFHQDDGLANKFYRQLQAWEKTLPDNACLVRLGWGSGFDAMTVRYAREGAKEISIQRPSRKKGGKQKFAAEGREDLTLYTPASRRLVEGGAPLGWAELRIVPANMPPDLEALEERLKRWQASIATEETPSRPSARVESDAPDTPATDEEIQKLIAARGRVRRERHEKPKSVAGDKQKRELDEAHKRTREQN